ncbi:hypothetical protein DFH07DRAFT_780577 [Mycena maculata]|uniref:Uncharacterized protein n=1 Tax=Mycena maculata TaxID=230809 RepID=A0AAD7I2M8_9AGAR|nr:hypothetical protein DFH07DRAFT_780577 [Mycena maculata]
MTLPLWCKFSVHHPSIGKQPGFSDSENAPRFDPAECIGQNKVYRDLPTQVTAAKFTAAHALPTVVIRQLPIPDITVTEFLLVPLPDILENDVPFLKQPSSWFSPDPPNCEDTSVHSIKSIPPLAFIRRLEETLPQAWLDGPYRSKSPSPAVGTFFL